MTDNNDGTDNTFAIEFDLLALDAEIRTHADPFLACEKLLAGGRQERAVRNAYGALAP